MKKLLTFLLAFIAVISVSACQLDSDDTVEYVTYESEEGPINVPKDPQRIVVLSTYNTGHVIAAGGHLVGATSWDFLNQRYSSYLEGVKEVSEDNIEGILALNPDLIIGQPGMANLDQLKEIAPTVLYTYGELTYLEQYVEIAKLLGTEEQALEWVDDFKSRAKASGDLFKETYGEDTSISVIEVYGKQLYVYGANWGRGTEILYQEMELAMPSPVRDDALEAGFYAISTEVLPDYMGDFVVLSKHLEADTSFEETLTYQQTDAYQNDRILTVDGTSFSYNDPITLDWQLQVFDDFFFGE
ncbi:ABC transporter substrate-binding protein [Mycoplasmatota bacterium]|nr:ABC transporter substrate-binding protein [Mycoplasmatota bacterium]